MADEQAIPGFFNFSMYFNCTVTREGVKTARVLCLLVLVFFLVTVNFQYRLDIQKGVSGSSSIRATYLPPPHILKLLTLGFHPAVADILWIRSMQLFAEELGPEDDNFLYRIISSIIDLDPRFYIAYIYGGVNLSVFARAPDFSNKILIKGLSQFPDDWQIPFFVGYNYFYEFKDFTQAAQYMEIASQRPQHPPWLPAFSARLYAQAGDPQLAVELLYRLVQGAGDDPLRERWKHELKTAMVKRDTSQLNRLVEEFSHREGRIPDTLEELVAAGITQKLPEEPFGGYYYIEQETGRVRSSSPVKEYKVHFVHD